MFDFYQNKSSTLEHTNKKLYTLLLFGVEKIVFFKNIVVQTKYTIIIIIIFVFNTLCQLCNNIWLRSTYSANTYMHTQCFYTPFTKNGEYLHIARHGSIQTLMLSCMSTGYKPLLHSHTKLDTPKPVTMRSTRSWATSTIPHYKILLSSRPTYWLGDGSAVRKNNCWNSQQSVCKINGFFLACLWVSSLKLYCSLKKH